MTPETIVTIALTILGAAFEAGRMRAKIDGLGASIARLDRKVDSLLSEARSSLASVQKPQDR